MDGSSSSSDFCAFSNDVKREGFFFFFFLLLTTTVSSDDDISVLLASGVFRFVSFFDRLQKEEEEDGGGNDAQEKETFKSPPLHAKKLGPMYRRSSYVYLPMLKCTDRRKTTKARKFFLGARVDIYSALNSFFFLIFFYGNPRARSPSSLEARGVALAIYFIAKLRRDVIWRQFAPRRTGGQIKQRTCCYGGRTTEQQII